MREAQTAALQAHVYWDLDKNEDAKKFRKDFKYVAEKENIPLTLRKRRDANCFQLMFSQPEKRSRISAGEARDRIVAAMSKNNGPMKKADILAATALSNATWNLRIRELTESGTVIRKGNRRDTTYTLA